MNTRPRIETIALNKIVALALAICPPSVALLGAFAVCFAQTPGPTSRPPSDEDGRQQVTTAAPQLMQSELSWKIAREQLESLVAPIALYPDPVLVQTLTASTYPLEIVRLKQWLIKNKNLKDKALAEAVAQQNWDPSVQALSAFPAVV